MAFPQVVTENTSEEEAADVTTHTVTLPASLVSGNLIVIAVAMDGNPGTVTPPTGFGNVITSVGDGVNAAFLAVWSKISNGSEGASITFASSAGQRSAHKSWQISGHDAAQAPEGTAIGSAGSASASPDPPNETPTGGAKDYLWLAVASKDTGDSTFSAFPTNYTNTGEVSQGGFAAAGCCIGWGRRELNAASENPSAFTIGESEEWVAGTVAIHPGAAAEPPTTALQARKVYVLP
jgi:hypothetical protein